MNYRKDILNKLLDKYEDKRGYILTPHHIIQIDIANTYKNYNNRYDNSYIDINEIIEELERENYITIKKDKDGLYKKIILNIEHIDDCYIETKRTTIPKLCEKMMKTLSFETNSDLLKTIIKDYRKKIENYESLPHGIKYDANRLKDILIVLDAILKLNQETYIRNFSTALFKDSKKFQKEFKSTIESILNEYTEEVEKKYILGYYNLCDNPTYVFIKGDVTIMFNKSTINVAEMPDGIALTSTSLDEIKKIVVNTNRVITIENLTTYYDSNEEDAAYVYLGGYHNSPKQRLLEKIYRDNKEKIYLHEGDLDIHGFLILENLKTKTKIPFKAYKMDVTILEQFYKAGLYKKLESYDIKTIKNKREKLEIYGDVLDYMLKHNCKVEQESRYAIGII